MKGHGLSRRPCGQRFLAEVSSLRNVEVPGSQETTTAQPRRLRKRDLNFVDISEMSNQSRGRRRGLFFELALITHAGEHHASFTSRKLGYGASRHVESSS